MRVFWGILGTVIAALVVGAVGWAYVSPSSFFEMFDDQKTVVVDEVYNTSSLYGDPVRVYDAYRSRYHCWLYVTMDPFNPGSIGKVAIRMEDRRMPTSSQPRFHVTFHVSDHGYATEGDIREVRPCLRTGISEVDKFLDGYRYWRATNGR